MKRLDDGPDGLNEDEWERAWKQAELEIRLRAVKLPAPRRPVTPKHGGKP